MPSPTGIQLKAAELQAKVDQRFNPEQRARLEEAKAELRRFAEKFGPFAPLALAIVGAEVLPEGMPNQVPDPSKNS